MAKENNEKKPEDKAELSLDELEDAAGGYILVRKGLSSPFNVIEDDTGRSRLNTQSNKIAKEYAQKIGVSGEKISPEEYARIFGHDFHY